MPISVPSEVYLLMLVAALFVFLILSYIVRSPIGTVLAAIRDDDQRTAFFGYNVVRYKVAAFVVSAAVSGLAGALFVKQFSFAAPSLIGFGLSTEVLIWVAVGGRNVLLAAFLGALLVRSVEGVLSDPTRGLLAFSARSVVCHNSRADALRPVRPNSDAASSASLPMSISAI